MLQFNYCILLDNQDDATAPSKGLSFVRDIRESFTMRLSVRDSTQRIINMGLARRGLSRRGEPPLSDGYAASFAQVPCLSVEGI